MIQALPGLNGLTDTAVTSCIFAMDTTKNLYMGIDAPSDDTGDSWYSIDDDVVKYSFRMRRGWQVAYPLEVVTFINIA